jgi:hypothetical protein
MTSFLLLPDSCVFVDLGRSFWTRGRVCCLQLLLILASAVILGSESLGTRNHILLSQIWDFPFRPLLRLAGIWWRYLTMPSTRDGHQYQYKMRYVNQTQHKPSARVKKYTLWALAPVFMHYFTVSVCKIRVLLEQKPTLRREILCIVRAKNKTTTISHNLHRTEV